MDFSKRYDPFLSPKWRADRTLQIVDRKPRAGRCRKHDDEPIRKYREYRIALKNATAETAEHLAYEFPDLALAEKIHTNEEELIRHTIEARLLAGQSDQEIAQQVSTLPSVIKRYEELFYNVRPRLTARDWILNQVLLPALPYEDNELKFSMRYFAYFGGPVVLDFIVYGANPSDRPASYEDCLKYLDKHWTGTVRRRSAMAARTVELNRFNVMELFAIHTRVMELERGLFSEEARNAVEQNIKSMLTDIPFAVGAKGAQLVKGSLLEAFDDGAMEERDEEVMLLAAGHLPASLKYLESNQEQVFREVVADERTLVADKAS